MYPLLPFSLNQPLAVDNAISTIGVIHKLIGKINEVIAEVNNIDSTANEYTDDQIAILRGELTIKFDEIELLINSLSGRIETNSINIQDLYSRITALRELVDNNTNFLNNKINDVELSLTNQIQQAYTTLWHYIDSKVDILEKLIESLTETKVFGLNGKLTTIQDALNQIINSFSKIDGITISTAKYAIENGYTYWGSASSYTQKYFNTITIGNLKNAYYGNPEALTYFGVDPTSSNGFFTKFVFRNCYKWISKNPLYSFIAIITQSGTAAWGNEAQSQIPTLIENIQGWFKWNFGYYNYSRFLINSNSNYVSTIEV